MIDLGLGRQGRASIKATSLVRLLRSTRLLPPWATGGIVIRNATVEGTLLLNNADLNIPLTFADVRFVGGSYRKHVFADERQIEAAISILNSHLRSTVLISSSEICGRVLINDSQFDERFELRHVQQRSLIQDSVGPTDHSCVGSGNAPLPSGVYIHSSVFRQSLRFDHTNLEALTASGNRVGRFLSWRARFGDFLSLSNNQFGEFIASSHLASRTEIMFNRIDNDFFLSGHEDTDHTIDSLDISSNQIEGGIGFRNFSERILPETIRLESNRAGDGSMVCIPRDWTGTCRSKAALLMAGSRSE